MHEAQANKPTLVYDLIEEFRQLIVDREIISITTKGFEFKIAKDGFLNQKSKEMVITNIQERLATFTKWRKGKYKLISIIEHQANLLARAIKKESDYKGFVGRI